jgi:hypothetical protein
MVGFSIKELLVPRTGAGYGSELIRNVNFAVTDGELTFDNSSVFGRSFGPWWDRHMASGEWREDKVAFGPFL